jgi:hypothetical protein
MHKAFVLVPDRLISANCQNNLYDYTQILKLFYFLIFGRSFAFYHKDFVATSSKEQSDLRASGNVSDVRSGPSRLWALSLFL